MVWEADSSFDDLPNVAVILRETPSPSVVFWKILLVYLVHLVGSEILE